MKKFVLSSILGAVVLLAVGAIAEAQQAGKVYRIGVLISAANQVAPFTDAFREGMRERGYVEAKNYALEIRSRGSKTDRLGNLAAELVRRKVDIIVTVGFPAVGAAMKATRTIPIVMRMSVDPVKSGLVASLAHPGGNITGVVSMGVGLSGKRFELLAETVPGISRVAVLTTSRDPRSRDWFKELDAASRVIGAKLQLLKARDPETIGSAFLAMKKERAEGLVVIPNASYVQYKELIIPLATKNRLPSIFAHSAHVESGGLMSYGANPVDEFRRTANYVDKILKGANAGELPIEQPMTFQFVINLKTAKQIGLTIPPNVLVRATKVIK